jgi:hypothetical protein
MYLFPFARQPNTARLEVSCYNLPLVLFDLRSDAVWLKVGALYQADSVLTGCADTENLPSHGVSKREPFILSPDG